MCEHCWDMQTKVTFFFNNAFFEMFFFCKLLQVEKYIHGQRNLFKINF